MGILDTKQMPISTLLYTISLLPLHFLCKSSNVPGPVSSDTPSWPGGAGGGPPGGEVGGGGTRGGVGTLGTSAASTLPILDEALLLECCSAFWDQAEYCTVCKRSPFHDEHVIFMPLRVPPCAKKDSCDWSRWRHVINCACAIHVFRRRLQLPVYSVFLKKRVFSCCVFSVDLWQTLLKGTYVKIQLKGSVQGTHLYLTTDSTIHSSQDENVDMCLCDRRCVTADSAVSVGTSKKN